MGSSELIKKYGGNIDKRDWFTLNGEDKAIYCCTASGKAYLEYYKALGGKPFGFTTGMPIEAYNKVEELGGESELYRECIRMGIKWEKMLGWDGHSDEIPE